MIYRNATTAGVGVFGVSVTALTTVLLFLVPQSFPTTAARNAYIDAWSVPIMTVGESVLIVGIPLLSAVLAYVLTNDGHSLQRVLTGCVVGGVVFGLGVAVLGETVMFFFADDPAVGHWSRTSSTSSNAEAESSPERSLESSVHTLPSVGDCSARKNEGTKRPERRTRTEDYSSPSFRRSCPRYSSSALRPFISKTLRSSLSSATWKACSAP